MVEKTTDMKRLQERRRTRWRPGIMRKMECSDRRGLLSEADVLDGCEIDRCALDGIGSDAEP